MKLVTCEHAWHQIAACFATVTRTTLQDVFDFCERDGSEVCWPELLEPYCRVGFHTQDMIDYCLSLNYYVTVISRTYYTARKNQKNVAAHSEEHLERRFYNYMKYRVGVLYVEGRMLVWDGIQLLDPINNQATDFIDEEIELFFIVSKMN